MARPFIVGYEDHGGWHPRWLLHVQEFRVYVYSDGTRRYVNPPVPAPGVARYTPESVAPWMDPEDLRLYDRKYELIETGRAYPPVPEGEELYWRPQGYERPVSLDGPWTWDTTYGPWRRLVTFADGWHGLSSPRNSRALSERLRTEKEARLRNEIQQMEARL